VGGEPHWGVGVISSFCEEEEEAEEMEGERERREREPAMRPTLSASSSRLWVLAGSGSLASEVSEFGAREGELEHDEGGEGKSTSGSSMCSTGVSTSSTSSPALVAAII
jgi:hypothetical protein